MIEYKFDDSIASCLKKYLNGDNPVKMLIDEEFAEECWSPSERYPYYQLRGRPVTPEQAMEIIIRTDTIWGCLRFEYNFLFPSSVNGILFENRYFDSSSIQRTGWVHPDGTIGQNHWPSIKYPYVEEIMAELVPVAESFPYLDFFAAISYKDSTLSTESYWDDKLWETYQKEGFTGIIECGIWVHDKTIEIVNRNKAVELYKTYEKLYEVPNKEIYEEDYHANQEPLELDWNYFRRGLELVEMPDLEIPLALSEKKLKEEALRGNDWCKKLLASKPTANRNS